MPPLTNCWPYAASAWMPIRCRNRSSFALPCPGTSLVRCSGDCWLTPEVRVKSALWWRYTDCGRGDCECEHLGKLTIATIRFCAPVHLDGPVVSWYIVRGAEITNIV